ncbi:MAG: SIMPL domain-containing protein [Candidatus Saccharimonadales bacterium]
MDEQKHSQTKSVTVRLNPWVLVVALALMLLVMLILWRPWQGAKTGERTVSVSGNATLKAEPDEYVFYPSYEFQNADKAAGLTELTAKSEEVIAGLKKVGVADKDIKTNASGYRDYYYYNEQSKTHTYSLQITAVTHTRDAAQKVQDYLVSTNPTGSVTPQAGFSEATKKRLEAKGRDEATKDARAKADQQAKNLGFKLGSVKTVADSSSGGVYPGPIMTMDAKAAVAPSSTSSLEVQPGQNDLSYTVQVTYYIK